MAEMPGLPQPSGPPPPLAPVPLPTGPVPLPPADLAKWREEITKARTLRKSVANWWDANLKAYAPDQSTDADTYATAVNTNRDFTLVERKKADLFFQRPDVTAIPTPLMAGQEAVVATHTTILNQHLGLTGVNAKRLVHQALFDVLCPAGTGWTVMGYDSATSDVPTAHPITGAPMTTPVPVYEDCFWHHLNPKFGLIPADFRDVVWDDAPWLGMELEIPLKVAKRKGWVPNDYTGQPRDQELQFKSTPKGSGGFEQVAKGVLLYYKSALYRDDRIHPQHLTLLVLIDGQDTPAEHKDCPYQDLDAHGALTPDSLIGFPIHPLTIRVQTDTAYVPSDCTISRPIVNELNKFREDMVLQRDATIARYSYNTDTLPTEALSKIVRSPIGGFIGLPGEAFTGDNAIRPLPQGAFPRENFQFNDYLDNDLARTHAIDADQSGASASRSQTATEAAIKDQNVSARLSLERGIVLDWYIQGCTKFSTLLQRYLSVAEAATIVGVQAAQAWDGWRHQVPSALAFHALPDSSLRTDLAFEKKRAMDEYSFLVNSPYVNPGELTKQLITKLGYQPTVFNAQPPTKPPEAPRISFAFSGADLNPLAPQFAIVSAVLQQSGMQIPPQALQEAQAQAQNALLASAVPGRVSSAPTTAAPPADHGGKLPQLENLSKHAAALTGGMDGTGQPNPAPGVQ